MKLTEEIESLEAIATAYETLSRQEFESAARHLNIARENDQLYKQHKKVAKALRIRAKKLKEMKEETQ